MPTETTLDHVKVATPEAPIHDLIRQRWSPRAFRNEPVTDEQLRSLFTAAAWAASSQNEQPWRFLVGRQGDETYKKIFATLAAGNQSWVKEAHVLIASVASKTFAKNGSPNGYALHDTGAACQSLALQATAMGMHVHGMGGFDKDTLRAFFGIPSSYEVGAVWAVGYTGDSETLPDNYKTLETSPRTRKALHEFVFTDWDKPASL